MNINELARKVDHWGFVPYRGFKMYLGGNDCGVAMRLLDGQQYEKTTMDCWERLCKDAELVIDVGAHTGIFTLAAYAQGVDTVISVEPYPMNYARLDLNLRANGFAVRGIFKGCAGRNNGFAAFGTRTNASYCTTGGSLDNIDSATATYSVELCRLDDLIPQDMHSKIKAIKIDVERTAKDVLAGMPEILKHKPDLIIECTENDLQLPGYDYFMLDDVRGVYRVPELVPEMESGKLAMTRLNRWCTAKR